MQTKELANKCVDHVSEYLSKLDITTEEGYAAMCEVAHRLDNLVLEVDCKINGIRETC